MGGYTTGTVWAGRERIFRHGVRCRTSCKGACWRRELCRGVVASSCSEKEPAGVYVHNNFASPYLLIHPFPTHALHMI